MFPYVLTHEELAHLLSGGFMHVVDDDDDLSIPKSRMCAACDVVTTEPSCWSCGGESLSPYSGGPVGGHYMSFRAT